MEIKTNVDELSEVVIRFSGDSGDGMQLTGTLFSDTSALLGNDIATFPDYPAEIRAPQGTVGGVSGFQVHFGSVRVNTPGDFCDVLVAMNPAALKANKRWVKKGGIIIVDFDSFDEKNLRKAGYLTDDPICEDKLMDYIVIKAPISSLTKESVADLQVDNKSVLRSKNMFALGMVYFMYDRPLNFTEKFFSEKFKKDQLVVETNTRVLRAGFSYAETIEAMPQYRIKAAEIEKGKYRSINGNTATAWGLIAAAEKAGLKLFCGSYPITPATEILQELAKRKDLGVMTFQAEDEIAGICTSIGASFAGAMAVTTTSGPGLALKSEAIGLAVMTELPLVIVDVQRGGPSTGLPTKTEQSDLLQALFGRNGECPLVVIAASSPADCFEYAFMAGKIALEHMTPVILLTDGFIANGTQPWKIPQMKDYPAIKPPIAKFKGEKFMPYLRNPENLVREWAIPGTAGLEHRVGGLEKMNVTGTVSYVPENHELMVGIREEKVQKIANIIPEIKVEGPESGDVLVIGWGGTYGHLASAVDQLQKEGYSVSLAHFNYIFPVPKNTEKVFSNFKKIVVCEINLGQFAKYLRMNFGQFKFMQINKVQGLPFTVVELNQKIKQILEGK